jgi:hypothetical protein
MVSKAIRVELAVAPGLEDFDEQLAELGRALRAAKHGQEQSVVLVEVVGLDLDFGAATDVTISRTTGNGP